MENSHICFVFIPNYKCLNNTSICLDDRFLFEFDPKSYTLTVRKNKKHVNNFWSKSIFSLTAIVGKNGAGKSTLIRYILDNVVDKYCKDTTNGIFVIESNGKYTVYSKIEPIINTNLKIEFVWEGNLFKINSFFYSPHFFIPSGNDYLTYEEAGEMYNGSDSSRLLKDFDDYSKIKNDNYQKTLVDYFKGYISRNAYRISTLLLHEYDLIQHYGLNPPRYIMIEPNMSGESYMNKRIREDNVGKREFLTIKKNLALSKKKNAIRRLFYHIICNTYETDVNFNKYIELIKKWINETGNTNIKDEEFDETIANYLEDFNISGNTKKY